MQEFNLFLNTQLDEQPCYELPLQWLIKMGQHLVSDDLWQLSK